MIQIEVCVDSLSGARVAEAAGAHRLELCMGFVEGGTTPSAGLISAVVDRCSIPATVLIRPRGGDFVISADESETIQRDIVRARELGAAGVAFGALTVGGDLDQDAMAAWIRLARPMTVTCHRAFDHARDPEATLDQLIELGVDRVLTSGQAPGVTQGIEVLAALQRRARGRIEVVPAGGVRASNGLELLERTACRSLHLSASGTTAGAALHRNPRVSVATAAPLPEGELRVTDGDEVRALIRCAEEAEALASILEDPDDGPR